MSRRLQRIGSAALLVLLFAATGETANRHVLMLHSVERGSLALDYFTGNFRVDLQKRAGGNITFTQFVVTPPGFGVSLEQPIVDFLRSAYFGRSRPDLVITVGGAAAAFLRKHRQQTFPDLPVLYAAVDERWLPESLAENETATAVAADYVGIVEDMLQLFPKTSTVFMVTGSGLVGQFWQKELQADFLRFQDRLTFFWSDQRTYQDILRRVSELPRNSVIFYLTLGTDAEGGAYAEDRVLADLHAAANAPIFAGLTPMLGRGIVGGRLLEIEGIHRTAADVAMRILNGEPPGQIETPVLRPGRPAFDARELERWGVSRAQLPADSRVLFEESGVWDRFKWLIFTSVSALAAQTMLIALLLINRRKRRRAERSLRESEGRFRFLANSAPVMIRISTAHMRCTDANLQWLAFTGRTLESERDGGWFTGVHPADRMGYVRDCMNALDRRQSFRIEYRLRQSDGDYRWVLENSAIRLARDGTPIGYVASTVDITDLKAARNAHSCMSGRLMGAQEQERTRLARELHDDIGLRMSSLVMDVVRLGEMMPDSSTEARTVMGDVADQMIALSRDIQGISHRLHSSKLEYLGLAIAASSFCGEMSSHHHVRIDYTHEGVPADLRKDIAIALFRVMQEAVSNAVKHSGAQQCTVSILGTDDTLTLEVVDFGRGFDSTAALQGAGLGLISMEERLKLVNGQLVIASTPGSGTAIRASVPLQAPAGDDAPSDVAATL